MTVGRLAGASATLRPRPCVRRPEEKPHLPRARTRPGLMRFVLLAWLLVLPRATAHAQGAGDAQDRGLAVVGQYGGELGAIAVQEPYAYLAVGPRLMVVDISNPRDAVVVGQTPPTSALAVDMLVRDGYAYVGRSGGLGIVDVSDPARPMEVGAVPIAVPPPAPLPASVAGTPRRVALDGNHAFIAAMGAGVRVIDVSDPRPTEVGAWVPVPGEEVVDVAAAGGYVYVGTQRTGGAFAAESGLHILDVSSPADPRELSFLSTINPVAGVAVAGHHAYLGGVPLQVVDISDPSNPTSVLELSGLFFAERVTVAGHYLYAGGQIFDISNPSAPFPMGAFPHRDMNRAAVAVAGDHAYVVTTDGLMVLDLSDRRRPTEIAAYIQPRLVQDVAVLGFTAYVGGYGGSGDGRIFVLDLVDPAQPRQLSSLARPGVGLRLAAAGSWVYVTSLGRLDVVDVRDPDRPVVAGSVESRSHKPPVVAGDYVYVARETIVADEGDLQIVSAADPARPVEVAAIRTGYTSDFAVSGTHVYILGGTDSG